MKIRVETDLINDLPDDRRPETEEETLRYLKMLEGTVEDSIDDVFDPEIVVIGNNQIDGKYRKFSLNDPEWSLLCHSCNSIIAKNVQAHEAFHEFEDHLDDERNPCYKYDRAVDRNYNRLRKMQEAMNDEE